MAKGKAQAKPVNVIEKVRQSMIKDFLDYEAGEECGIRFHEKHIAKNYPDDSGDKARLGTYVEYLVFKTIPERMKKLGLKPEPEYMETPKKAVLAGKMKPEDLKVDHMTSDYREAHRKADIVNQVIKDMGVTVVAVNVEVENEWGAGILDVVVTGGPFGKEEVIWDMKYTGLADSRWSEYGFLFEGFKSQDQKDHHGIQGKQYHLITGKRFFFFLVSSSNKEDTVTLVECVFSDIGLMRHRDLALQVRDKINLQLQIGFVARPEFKRCNECAINSRCSYRTKIPTIRKVNFDEENTI